MPEKRSLYSEDPEIVLALSPAAFKIKRKRMIRKRERVLEKEKDKESNAEGEHKEGSKEDRRRKEERVGGMMGGQTEMEASFGTAASASRSVAAAGNLAAVGLNLTHLSGVSGN